MCEDALGLNHTVCVCVRNRNVYTVNIQTNGWARKLPRANSCLQLLSLIDDNKLQTYCVMPFLQKSGQPEHCAVQETLRNYLIVSFFL